MASVAAAAGSSIACCGASCLSSALCSAFSCKCSNGGSKATYLGLMGLGTLLSMVLRFWGSTFVVHFYGFTVGCTGKFAARCLGDQAVYRVSFALTVFFTLMMVITACSRDFHLGNWLGKIALLFIVLAGSFFVPSPVFDVYADIARVASALFLVIQILILIDFAYTWNESWVARGERKWDAAVLICSLAMYVVALVGIILMFVYFGGCDANNAFIAVTLLGIIIVTSLSISGWVEHGAILTSAIVSLYSVYLCWAAITSQPEKACNPTLGAGTDVPRVVIGLIVTTVSLVFTSYGAAKSAPNVFHNDSDEDDDAGALSSPLYEDTEAGGADKTDDRRAASKDRHDDDEEEKKPKVDERVWLFHLIMATSSLYLAMLVTNWSISDSATEASAANPGVSSESVWVKILSQWVTLGLYTWTLIAPQCLSGRDFS
eukprot:PLAT16042.2.p1 GENE.PLAT16042.2~~PLAT16042.2.p1  ORF type:complete len:440 (+),score=159.38 PLAT16042.2:26-1321(+)